MGSITRHQTGIVYFMETHLLSLRVIASPKGAAISFLLGLLRHSAPRNDRLNNAFALVLAWLVFFWISSVWGGQTQPSFPSKIYAVTSRGVTAQFGGKKPPSGVSLEFGVSALWFTFGGEETPCLFKPSGELFFSDWRFDLFSPDGAHVLLLQDHYGPYHIVATHRLKDYLLGHAKPDYVVTRMTKSGDPALVHSEGHWVSEKQIQFSVACCGTLAIVTYRLP